MVFGFVLSSEVKKINSFLRIQSSPFVTRQRKKYNFLFLACYTLLVEFFLLIFFDLLAVHLLNFK